MTRSTIRAEPVWAETFTGLWIDRFARRVKVLDSVRGDHVRPLQQDDTSVLRSVRMSLAGAVAAAVFAVFAVAFYRCYTTE